MEILIIHTILENMGFKYNKIFSTKENKLYSNGILEISISDDKIYTKINNYRVSTPNITIKGLLSHIQLINKYLDNNLEEVI